MSAGGVIVRKGQQGWDILLMKDMNDTWTFPKGLIDAGESPVEAAQRECKEEVGISNLTLISPLTPIHYIYKRGELIEKYVHYFLFSSVGNEELTPQTDEGISDIQWVPIDEGLERIGYEKTNKPLLEEAYSKLFKN